MFALPANAELARLSPRFIEAFADFVGVLESFIFYRACQMQSCEFVEHKAFYEAGSGLIRESVVE